MAEIGSWNGHQFIVSPKLIRGFTGLTIKGSSEVEEKESGGQKYVSRKSSRPSEISMTVELNAYTGCDVKTEALKFVQEANDGARNYFYLGGKKLIACKLMLTEASISETEIAPGGKWTRCKVKLTMKQSAKYDGTGGTSSGGGSSGGSSGGSKKSSTKRTSTKTTKTTKTSLLDKAKNVVSNAISAVKNVVSKTKTGLAAAVSAVNKAKATSSAAKKKTTTVVKKVSTGAKKVKIMKK